VAVLERALGNLVAREDALAASRTALHAVASVAQGTLVRAAR
jgi:hypothetical protein